VPSVSVSLSDAVDRHLPLVSVRSGRPADGYLAVPVGLRFTERIGWTLTWRSPGRPLVRLPLTSKEFDGVMRLRRAERSGVVNAVVFVMLGAALARVPILFLLGLMIGALSIMLIVAARIGLRRALPEVSGHRGIVTITGVHEEFVTSVESGTRRYS
jgi:hypothetical protein